MRFPVPLESHQYGNPERILEEKQAREANERKRAEKRQTLTVKAGWSKARHAAENLFDFAPEADRPSCPATPSNSAHAGNRKDSL